MASDFVHLVGIVINEIIELEGLETKMDKVNNDIAVDVHHALIYHLTTWIALRFVKFCDEGFFFYEKLFQIVEANFASLF